MTAASRFYLRHDSLPDTISLSYCWALREMQPPARGHKKARLEKRAKKRVVKERSAPIPTVPLDSSNHTLPQWHDLGFRSFRFSPHGMGSIEPEQACRDVVIGRIGGGPARLL